MSTYKLYYFPGRGRAETARLIFKQAGVEFEDVRLAGEEWQAFKPNTPYGSMPLLEVDGKKLAGSGAIARLLAERFGLAGSNDFENAEIESIIDVGNDLAKKIGDTHFEKDETRKAEMMKKLGEEHFPKYLGIFDNLIKNNASGWVYGAKVTYADLALFNVLSWVKMSPGPVLDSYPNILKNVAAVEALPNIAKWLKERPETQF